ncbi:hypothetical protein VP01_1477g3 [Puccinia sorghi]|uniref:Integrase catalytic domain-containing protein n=1 Tax=Puccinia sorghi TaxID=27349 RepID=A0A0L6VJK0_9BASI|nr:hypothetical protein VP01_1477g3 [Puccinia sorghi]
MANNVPRSAPVVPIAPVGANDGFRQAMLKTALETIPQLNEENYSIWKDKVTALLKLRGVLTALNNTQIPLGESDNAELTMLLLSKMDSVTHQNVVTADNSESAQKIWSSIKERFASSQSSNRARMFNDFLYVKFQEDAIETFVTDIKVSIKKLVDVGIELPQDILAYLVLFKFPNSLQSLKRQIMHSDKDLTVKFETSSKPTEAALFNSKGKSSKASGNERLDGPNSSSKSTRCKTGFHNPKQDKNHSSDNCWHLHPEIAPDWWRESQEQWKANKGKEKTNYFMSLLTLWIESGDPKSRIILDSGASAHIFNDERFFEYLEFGEFDVIKTGKHNATMPIKGKGTVRLTWGKASIALSNCLYVPDIVINLISAGKLDSKGCTLRAENSNFIVSKDGKLVLKGLIKNGLYSVNNPSSIGSKNNDTLANISLPKELLRETHEKFGHASIQRIEPFIDRSISKSERDQFECKACILAKITKQSFNNESKLASRPFEHLHLDLIGPIKPESSLKHRFILTVVDNHTGYLAGFPLVNKDDTTDVLIDLLESEKSRRGYFPSLICSDGGGEFIGHRAERANRTIVESMRATLNGSGIPKRFWHEIVKSCCLGLNQLPKKGNTSSPWELLHDRQFPTNFLRPIGTPAVVLNMTGIKGRKFDSKGEEGRLIGFNVPLLLYRVITQSGRIVESKHVRFLKRDDSVIKVDVDNELQFLPEDYPRSQELVPPAIESTPANNHRENNPDRDDSAESDENSSDESNHEIEQQLTQPTSTPTPPVQQTSRILRDRSLIKPPTRYGFHHYYEPNTFESAIRCNDAKYWKQAIEKERFSNSSRHEPNTILGMKFERENNKIKLSLPNHIEHGLEELGLTNCKTSTTPLTPNLKLREASDDDHSRFKKLNINYRSAIGLLNHIAQLTRPDISFAVSSLARYSVKPGMTHWHEVKKVWQYLKGTADLKLTLEIKHPNQLLQIYSDASWGDDPQDRTSQSGHLCFLFGSLISWNSSKQRCVTYSSTEAELNPLVDAFHEGIWLKALLAEMWHIQLDAATHLIDDPDLLEQLMISEEEFNLKFTNEHLIDNKGLDDKPNSPSPVTGSVGILPPLFLFRFLFSVTSL